MDLCTAPSGWLRHKALTPCACVRVCKNVCLWMCVYAAHWNRPRFEARWWCSLVIVYGTVIPHPMFLFIICDAAFPHSLPHLVCIEFPSVSSPTAAWTLQWWSLLSHSKCSVITMYPQHCITHAIGLVFFHQSKGAFYCDLADVRFLTLLGVNQPLKFFNPHLS